MTTTNSQSELRCALAKRRNRPVTAGLVTAGHDVRFWHKAEIMQALGDICFRE
jgi:hypothetical protein